LNGEAERKDMAKKIKTSKKNRICRINGCKHILSIYNAETSCHVHRRIASGREVVLK